AEAVLAGELHIGRRRMQEFRAVLEELLSAGRIRRTGDGLLRPRTRPGLVQGTIKKTSSGAGFLIPHPTQSTAGEGRPDISVAPHDLGDAHTGDEVLVQLSGRARPGDRRLRGRVVEILQRSTRTSVGVYLERDEQGHVQVDGTTLNEPVYVGDPG